MVLASFHLLWSEKTFFVLFKNLDSGQSQLINYPMYLNVIIWAMFLELINVLKSECPKKYQIIIEKCYDVNKIP